VSWRVFWVPSDAVRGGVRGSVVEGWEDLPSREDAVGVLAGDPIFLSPDHRVDPLLGLYGQSGTFRRYEEETRRNYATDIALLLTFLWKRGRGWLEATPRDRRTTSIGGGERRGIRAGSAGRSGDVNWPRSPACSGGLSVMGTWCAVRCSCGRSWGATAR
jgi:hypothetical protein